MSVSKSSRHRARELVVQGLYQWQVGGQDGAAIQAHAASDNLLKKADAALYHQLFDDVLTHAETLRTNLARHTDRAWNAISPIERSILLLGACELKLHPETPYRVIINEAIELAKTFGGADGHKFINGILDKFGALVRVGENTSSRPAHANPAAPTTK
ncbi:MAG TPA: transcription antitermination factor NusB [Rhodocyclaceae bacterium]|nr:transcription antitermination factor NusB [Rhodocyclaceae bacterium]